MRILRKFLFPFGFLYGLILLFRNFLYDRGVLESRRFSLPVICVGNLSVGGTGKTPMIEYLLVLLNPNYKTATLSRGYGRDTSGFRIVQEKDTAEEAGDEPLQFKTKFKNTIVAVDEQRSRGIDLLKQQFSPEVVLLDDAFQHRKVEAGLNILLSSHQELYVDDLMLPAGNLREPVSGAKRADVIVITKCPAGLSNSQQKKIRKRLKLKKHQRLFFSFIQYSEKAHNSEGSLPLNAFSDEKITLITGIANPKPLVEFLNKRNLEFEHRNFPDHHQFTGKELKTFEAASTILTTEKDYMRLRDSLEHDRLYYLPIKMRFLGNASEFDEVVENYVENSGKKK